MKKKLLALAILGASVGVAAAGPYTGDATLSRDAAGIITYTDNLVYTPTAIADPISAASYQQAYQTFANASWNTVTGNLVQLGEFVKLINQGGSSNGAQFVAETATVSNARAALVSLVPSLNTGLQNLSGGGYTTVGHNAYGQNYINTVDTAGNPVSNGLTVNATETGATWTYAYFTQPEPKPAPVDPVIPAPAPEVGAGIPAPEAEF